MTQYRTADLEALAAIIQETPGISEDQADELAAWLDAEAAEYRRLDAANAYADYLEAQVALCEKSEISEISPEPARHIVARRATPLINRRRVEHQARALRPVLLPPYCHECYGEGYIKMSTGGHFSDWVAVPCRACRPVAA